VLEMFSPSLVEEEFAFLAFEERDMMFDLLS
jgi:hypothetical protein